MKPPLRTAVPSAVTTATLLGPAEPAGVTAVTVVEFTTVTPVAGTSSIVTELTPARLKPVIVIAVPPRVEPELGITEVTVGGAMYVKPFARLV
jgi:hypothetical protein